MIPKRNRWSCCVASKYLQSQNTIFISWSNIKLSWSSSDCPLPLSRRKLSISNSILALRGICSTQNSGSVSKSDWLTNQWHFKTLISTIPNSHGNVIFQIAIILIQIEISLTIISQWNMLVASTLTITFFSSTNCSTPLSVHSAILAMCVAKYIRLRSLCRIICSSQGFQDPANLCYHVINH